MHTFQPTTVYCKQPPINHWFLMVCGKDLDLDAVDGETILGMTIKDGYEKKPHETIAMLRELYNDNPEMLEKVIGAENVKKIIQP